MTSELFDVVVVGAGIAGICTAVQLEKQLGLRNFKIFERGPDIGGTWRENTYPGCACDVESHWYSASFELNPDWNERFPSQPEILGYWERLVDKYNIRRYIQFNTEVISADWDEVEQFWRLKLSEPDSNGSNRTRNVAGRSLISAVGGFWRPFMPDLPGLKDFKGKIIHSATWDHSADFTGKKVAVIGGGTSAAQLVPAISEDKTTSVVNFSRTPMWFIARGQFNFPGWAKWAFRHIPFVLRSYRNWIMFRSDVRFLAFYQRSPLQPYLTKLLTGYMKKAAPEKYHAALTASYPPGCKRIVVDPDFLASLHRPNVEYVPTAVTEVGADRVITKTGTAYPTDVIIFATGYETQPGSVTVRGRNGITMQEYFASIGGPASYMATTLSNFPNMYTILGPNSATGHASIIFTIEAQIDYAINMIRPVVQGAVKSFEVKESALLRFNEKMQKHLQPTVWTQCESFYRIGGTGKVFTIIPGPASLFWWWCQNPTWQDYNVIGGGERWAKSQRSSLLGRGLAVCVLAASLAVASSWGWALRFLS